MPEATVCMTHASRQIGCVFACKRCKIICITFQLVSVPPQRRGFLSKKKRRKKQICGSVRERSLTDTKILNQIFD